jgi:hypothetical protein
MQSEEDNIKALRAQKNLYRHELKGLTTKIAEMLDKFNLDEGEDVVSYHDLSKLEFDVPYHVNDKVMFIRQQNIDPNTLLFITHMKAGGKFGKQSHDVIENCEIVKGRLIEEMRNDKVYVEGDIVTYQSFEVHKPYTDVSSIYHVTFTRTNKNLTPSQT